MFLSVFDAVFGGMSIQSASTLKYYLKGYKLGAIETFVTQMLGSKPHLNCYRG